MALNSPPTGRLRSRGPRFAIDDGAQILVEFCLILPLLLLVLSVATDVVRYVHIRQVAEEVVTDAAMYAAIRSPITGNLPTAEQVDARIAGTFPGALGTCAVVKNLEAVVDGEPAVHISLSCQARPFCPALDRVLPSPFTIQAAAWYPRR